MGKQTLTPILPPWKAVIRPEDALVLYFQFGNLKLKSIRNQWCIVQDDPAKPSFLGVWHQPQHLVEQAFAQGTSLPSEASKAIATWLPSGMSCLRFQLEADTIIGYSLSGLLQACMTLKPHLQNTATFGFEPNLPILIGVPWIRDPQAQSDAFSVPTFLELPWGLFLSPNQFGRWKHPLGPVTSLGSQFTELWHTRLIPMSIVDPDTGKSTEKPLNLRALWSVDYEQVKKNIEEKKVFANPLFETSLSALDRFNIVEQTSNLNNLSKVAPINVKSLMLSSLGAWLDVNAAWNVGEKSDWVHRAAMGRDYYVRVTSRGFLLPFGHRASRMEVTERIFETITRNNENHRVAVLRKRVYVVVNEPEKTYAPDRYQFPFRQVRIITPATPVLSSNATDNFFPEVNNQAFAFSLELTDGAYHKIDFKMPLYFVEKNTAYNTPVSLAIAYNSQKNLSKRQTLLRNQAVAYGSLTIHPELIPKSLLETETITFAVNAVAPDKLAEIQTQQHVPVLPAVDSFAAVIPALKALTENTEQSKLMSTPQILTLVPTNDGQVFAQLQAKLNTSFPVEKVGGLVRPAIGIEGVSSLYGVVGDVASVKQNLFNPETYFDDSALPKLFGVLPLAAIIAQNQDDGAIPKITRETVGDVVTTQVDWTSDLKKFSVFEPQEFGKLILNTTLTNKPDSNEGAILSVKSSLTKFDIVLANVIRLEFEKITFTALDGKKVDVAAEFKEIVFEGDLSFLNALKTFIPLLGFIDPPNLDVTAEGVKAGYTLGLPAIGVGAFALQNVSLSAGFCVPFLGDPMSVRFAFSERENPFMLTISMFAGGGFFGISLSPQGIDTLEASIEFGGNISLNLGVATGGVYVMAGIYFKYEFEKKESQLAGYLRCGGALRVLKIITISVEFYLELRYDQGKAIARASVRVKVKIAFFSKSVTLETERKFSGSTGDPTFDQTTTPEDWMLYCNAFGSYLN